jgi:endonuclease/exonuclease/phosphatase family metal-dependent hydrolase
MENLKVLTYNIWFDRRTLDDRLPTLISEMRRASADVICLQEVIDPSFEAIRTAFDSEYDISPKPDPKMLGYISSYYTIMLVKKGLSATFKFHPLPSSMERYLLWADFAVATPTQPRLNVRVCNVHLESMNSASNRAEQLATASLFLQPGQSLHADTSPIHVAVLCGDFNFCSYRNYLKPLPTNDAERALLENNVLSKTVPQLQDCWSLLYPNKKGYTFDSTNNDACIRSDGLTEQMRYDRVLVSPNTHFAAFEMSLIGTRACTDRFHDVSNVPGRPSRPAHRAAGLKLDHNSDDESSIVSESTTGKTVLQVSVPEDAEFVSDDERAKTPKKRRLSLFPSDHFGLVCLFHIK